VHDLYHIGEQIQGDSAKHLFLMMQRESPFSLQVAGQKGADSAFSDFLGKWNGVQLSYFQAYRN
jgi:hypothetical protein